MIPPDFRLPYGIGETLSYASQRLLMARHPLAREFSASEISKIAPIKGKIPPTETYAALTATSFAGWTFGVQGLVARPMELSMADLLRCPMTTQTTLHACEEGWSYIAQWQGVQLSYLLNRAGVSVKAKFVVFYCYDGWWGSIDMEDAWHPQTLIALAMNGKELSAGHGAPVRLRVARQMGYKSYKYLSHIAAVDSLKAVGNGTGDFVVGRKYSWYAGI
jgi:DMSO/TMAO reductase YedYZ molybdopterin-dependent catalytic subunit